MRDGIRRDIGRERLQAMVAGFESCIDKGCDDRVARRRVRMDDSIVPLKLTGKRGGVRDFSVHGTDTPIRGQFLGMTAESRNCMPAVYGFRKNLGTDESGSSDQCDFPFASLNRLGSMKRAKSARGRGCRY